MSLKHILVPYTGRASEMRALRAALELAKKRNAHVEVWHIQPDPIDVITTGSFSVAPMYCYPPNSTLADLRRACARRREKAEKAFIKAIHKMQVERRQEALPLHYPTASFHGTLGHPGPVLAEHGRVSDLIVMTRWPDGTEYSETLLSALFSTGKPVLLIPPSKTPQSLNGRTLIAWNGSIEAARAVDMAMPLIEAGKVWVVATRDEEEAPTDRVPPRDLIPYLLEHDVHVQEDVREVGSTDLPENVLKAAHALDAGLIVMGAYGHSRIRESVFGGMTDFMLRKSDLPVLFAH